MDNRIDFVQVGSEHTWKKYNIDSTTRYAWEKRQANTSLLYEWNEYNADVVQTTYTWKQYNQEAITKYHAWEKVPAPERNFIYKWNEWDYDLTIAPGSKYHEFIKYTPAYEWGKYNATLTGQPVYGWKEPNQDNSKTYSSNLITGTWDKSGLNNAYLYLFNFKFNSSQFNINDFAYITDYSNSDISNLLTLRQGRAVTPGTGEIVYSIDDIVYDTINTATIELTQALMTFILEDGTVVSEPPTDKPYYSVFYSKSGQEIDTEYYELRKRQYIFPFGTVQDDIKKYHDDTDIPRYFAYELLGVWDNIDNGATILPIIMLIKTTPGSSTKKVYMSNISISTLEKTTVGDYTYILGNYIETVTSSDPNAYPEEGWQNGYAYIKFNTVGPGTYVDTIRDKSRGSYPDGGVNTDGYYYSYAGEKIADKGYIAGSMSNPPEPSKVVTSLINNAYPTDGVKGSYYYKYIGRDFTSLATIYEWLPHVDFYRLYAGNTNTSPETFEKTSSQSSDPNPKLTWSIYMGREAPNKTLVSTNSLTDGYMLLVNQDDETNLDSYALKDKINNAIASGYQYMYISFDQTTVYYLPKSVSVIFSRTITQVNPVRYTKTISITIYGVQPMYTRTNPLTHEYLPGKYLGIISDFSNNYYLDSFTSYKPTTYIGEVTSTDVTNYPQNGSQGSFYYILSSDYQSAWTKGNLLGTVTSYTQDYPVDGVQNGKWYVQQSSTTIYSPGDLIEYVYSDDPGTYPVDGYQSGYYYVRYTNSTNYPSAFVDLVQATTEDAYPKNGEQDGYWYVYIGRQSDIIFTLDKEDILSAISYKQDINSDGDLTIGNTASAEISFTAVLNETTLGLVGKKCICYSRQADNIEYDKMGVFIISSVEKQNDHTVKVEGYDIMNNFDSGATQLINTLKFPMTLQDLFIQVCQFFNADVSLNFVNSEILISGLDNFSQSPTGLELLSYIAQMAGGYAFVNLDNEIEIGNYKQSNISITPSNATNILQKEYTVPAIDKLIIRTQDSEYIFGTGDNAYLIEDNPLMEKEDVRNAAAPIILEKLQEYGVYVPAEISLIKDYGINCGDIVLVNSKPALIMSKQMSGSGIKLACYGNVTREPIEETQTGSSSIVTTEYTGDFNRSSSSVVSSITNNSTGGSTKYSQSSSNVEISSGDSSLQVSSRGVSGSYGDNAVSINESGVSIEGAFNLDSANFSSFVIKPVEDGFWIGNSNMTSGLLYDISEGILKKYYNGQILKEW